MPEKDITQTGPVGLKGLSALDQRQGAEDRYRSKSLEERFGSMSSGITPQQAHQQVVRDLGEFKPLASGQDIGSSIYDKNIYSQSEFENAGDVRANNQSAAAQLGAGLVKMGTTAVTTFLDGTLGAIYGLGTGFANLTDENPETSFWQGLWNNDFNRAMAKAQEKMEELVPNYYTEAQLNAPWYSATNLLSANFWGDKFLKNMGFTIGAMATMAIPGFDASWAAKGISGLGRLLKVGDTGLKAFDKAGKITQRVVNTLISASGEGAIEAINAVNDNYNAELGNLEVQRRQAVQEAQDWYKEHQYEIRNEGYASPYEIYMNRLAQIDADYNTAKGELEKGLTNVGNSVYAANIAVLSLTNNLEFGKYLKGGYNLQKGFLGLDMITKEGKTESLKDFGKALAKGEGKLAVGEEVGKLSAGKVISGTLGRALSEGFEEGAQRMASDTEQMYEQSRINRWAKQQGDDTFYSKGINPDVTDDLVNRFKAMHQAWNASFGDAASTGWEEVLLGALTGGIGTFNIKQDRNGKTKFGWQGGIYEEFADAKERRADAEKFVKTFNDRVNTDDFRKKISHAITAMSLTEDMDRFLQMENTLRYKNAELAAVVNDALYFQDAGALDSFKSFYEAMAEGISDEDIEIVKSQLKRLNGASPYDKMSSDEIRQVLQNKAKSTLDKIDTTIKTHEHHTLTYGSQAVRDAEKVVDDEFPGGAQNLAEAALREMTAKASLIADLERRKSELQDQIDQMDEVTKSIRGTASEEKAIKEIDESLKEHRADYEKMKKDISSIEKTIQRNYHIAQRRQLAKDNATFKTAMKEATTLQEVADLYFASDDKYRQNTYEEALAEADEEHKPILESFKPFLGAVNSLAGIVEKIAEEEFPMQEDMDDEGIRSLEMNRGFLMANIGDLLNYVIDDFVNDDQTGTFGKEDLETAIRNMVEALRTNPTNNEQERQSNEFYAQKLEQVANNLDAMDIVYKAAEPRPEVEETEEEKPEETEEEEGEEEDDDEGYFAPGTVHTEEEGEEEEPKVAEEPETTVVNDRVNAEKYAKRRLKKALGEDLDKFVEILNQDNPSEEDRQWFAEKLKDKRLSNFATKFARKAKPAEAPEEIDNKEAAELAESESDMRPASETTQEEDNKSREDGDKSGVSMRANPYRPYLMGVKDHTGILNGIRSVALDNAVNPEYYENWYALPFAKGVDYIVNNYMWKLMKVAGKENKLKVQYAKYYPGGIQATGVNKAHIALVIPYTDAVKSVLSPDNPSIQGNIIENGKYIVVGAVGYATGNKALETAHNAIDAAIEAQRGVEGTSEWEVLKEGENGEWVNYIYDVSPGYVIRKNDKDDTGDMSLETLLKEDNDTGQTVDDLRFTIWYGSEDSRVGIHQEPITIRKGDQLYRDDIHEPGQVVVWIPSANGKFIPQYVSPVSYNELTPEKNGQVYADIQSTVAKIAHNRANKKELVKALAELRGTNTIPGLLITSHLENEGNQIIYDEETNSIVLQVDGQFANDKTINLSKEGLTEEEIKNRILDMLKTINPRVAVDGHTLRTNPGYYVNSGIIQVNLRKWGVVNARAFVYPPDASGHIDPQFKPADDRRKTERVETQEVQAVYFISGKKYRMIDGKIYDNRDVEVTDTEIGQQFADILNIEHGAAEPFIDEKTNSKYYKIGDRIYHKTRNAGYNKLSDVQAKRVQAKMDKQDAQKHLEESRAASIAEIQKQIEAVERQKARLKPSQFKDSGPATLQEVVADALVGLTKPINWQNILSEVGSHLRTELKKYLSGANRMASATSHYYIDDLVMDIIGDNPIGLNEDDSQDIREAIIDFFRSGMTKRDLKKVSQTNRYTEAIAELDNMIDELQRELDRLKSGKPAETKEPAPVEDLPEEVIHLGSEGLFDNEEEPWEQSQAPKPAPAPAPVPQSPNVGRKESLTDLEKEARKTNFVNMYMDYSMAADGEDLERVEAFEAVVGTDATKYDEMLKNSELRDKFYAVHDEKSLIDFMDDVIACGI